MPAVDAHLVEPLLQADGRRPLYSSGSSRTGSSRSRTSRACATRPRPRSRSRSPTSTSTAASGHACSSSSQRSRRRRGSTASSRRCFRTTGRCSACSRRPGSRSRAMPPAARSSSRFPIAPTERYLEHVGSRDHEAVVASLRPFFEPVSVAVVGASPRQASIGGGLFRNILDADFTGAAYPVNRQAASRSPASAATRRSRRSRTRSTSRSSAFRASTSSRLRKTRCAAEFARSA